MPPPTKTVLAAQSKRRGNREMRLPWWKKLAFGLLTATAVLVLLECSLAMLGVRPLLTRRDPYVGFSGAVPHFQEKGELGRPPRLRTADSKLGYVNDQAFAVDKSDSTFRIFCLGGSTTFGRPYDDATSFVGWLRTMLETAGPQQDWEVINAGGVSYASYRVAAVMEEVIAYQPDLFIIYAGHNEFLEARTYGELRHQSSSRQWLTLAATRLRTASLIDNLWQSRSTQPAVHELSDEVDTILDHTVGPTSYERSVAERRDIVAHFELSVARMIDLATAAGADVVFVRPACNAKDCAPFKSEPSAGLSDEQQRLWQDFFDSGLRLQESSRDSEALAAFDEALAIDDRHALLHYSLGKSLFALDRFEQARVSFGKAIDEDVCPLRMTSDLGLALDRVIAQSGAPVVDMQTLLEQHCRDEFGNAVLGREVFLDHVHPTISAHGLLASALAECLHEQGLLPCDVQLSENQQNKVRQRVYATIDPAARARAEGNLARVLYWAGKVDEAGPLALSCHEHEDDPRILLIAGVYLHSQGETDRALDFLRRARAMNPEDARFHETLVAVEESSSLANTRRDIINDALTSVSD